jgi:hypothetical protein
MSSQSKRHPGRVLVMLPAIFAVLCAFATLAAAQDQPAPKWELYGGYSFFHPGADVHGQLPGALLPLSSRMEANPRGADASVTYNFNHYIEFESDDGKSARAVANRNVYTRCPFPAISIFAYHFLLSLSPLESTLAKVYRNKGL